MIEMIPQNAKKAFKRDTATGVIALRSDDRTSASQVPAWCEIAGHTFLGSEPADDHVCYFVRRREDRFVAERMSTLLTDDTLDKACVGAGGRHRRCLGR